MFCATEDETKPTTTIRPPNIATTLNPTFLTANVISGAGNTFRMQFTDNANLTYQRQFDYITSRLHSNLS